MDQYSGCSEEVKDGMMRSRKVIMSITTHTPHLGEALFSFGKVLINNPSPKDIWTQCLTLLAALLQYFTDFMGAADLAHSKELSEDTAARLDRETAFRVAYEGAIKLRKILQGLFGEEFLLLIGFGGTTSSYPPDLLRQLQDVLNKVSGLAEWPETDEEDMPQYPQDKVIKRLNNLINPIDVALQAVDREVQESKATMIKRWKAKEEHDRVYQAVGNIASNLCLLVNEPELAARLTPTIPSPPKKGEEAPQGEAPEGTSEEAEVEEPVGVVTP